jgi:hypothetical protein
MRLILPLVLALAACSTGSQISPIDGLRGLVDPADADRRGAVELVVKSAYPTILDEIADGGGPNLTQAFDTSGVPVGDRPTRIIQLDGQLGLYAENPSALVLAITAFGTNRATGS